MLKITNVKTKIINSISKITLLITKIYKSTSKFRISYSI